MTTVRSASQAVGLWLAIWFLASPILAARLNLHTSGLEIGAAQWQRQLLQCQEFPSTARPWTGGAYVAPDQELYLSRDYISTQGIVVEGKLYVAADRDIGITVPFIFVNGSGLFQIGSPACYHTQKVTITLTNGAATPSGKHGVKALAVDGMGSLKFYGAKGLGPNSWVYLNSTARAGATTLVLSQRVDWEAGDRIVIPSTDFEPEQTENITIASVTGNTVTLTQPLRFMHYGAITQGIDERAEIGLLSRNILVQGADDAAIGGHMMSSSQLPGSIHLEGVEFYNMGQDMIGRYPIHLHMMFNAGYGCIIRSNSVWKSQFRAVTIHGTSGALVANNVGYDVQGHMYFLEDGSEMDNSFIRNLGIMARPLTRPGERLGSDGARGLSTFWITNANNTFADNVAAATQSVGFWFVARLGVRGPSARSGRFTTVRPGNMELKMFHNNRAHSVRQCLQWESPVFDAEDVPLDATQPPVVGWGPRDPVTRQRLTTTFEGFSCHHAYDVGAWLRAAKARFYRSKFADCMEAFQIATNGQHPGNDVTSIMEESLLVGRTDNPGTNMRTANQYTESWTGRSCPSNPGGLNGVRMYDGPMAMRNNVFRNFNRTACRQEAVSSLFTVRRYNTFQMATSTSVSNSKFCRVENRVFIVDEFATGGFVTSMLDFDGSMTGYPLSQVMRNWGFYNPSNNGQGLCRSFDSGNTVACPHTYGNVELSTWPNIDQPHNAIRITRFPTETVRQRTLNYTTSQRLSGNIGVFNSVIASVGAAYAYTWPTFTPWQVTVQLMYTDRAQRLSVALCLPPGTLITAVKRGMADNGGNQVAAATAALPNMAAGSFDVAWNGVSDGNTYFYDAASGVVYFTVVQRNTAAAERRGRDGCPAAGCDYVVVQTNLPVATGGAGVSVDSCASRVRDQPASLASAWLSTPFRAAVDNNDDCTATIPDTASLFGSI